MNMRTFRKLSTSAARAVAAFLLAAGAITMASCAGPRKVKYADKYGFLPGNDALANSEALQRCLDGGGKIVVRKEGIYDVCRTLFLDSGTDLSFRRRCSHQQDQGSRRSHRPPRVPEPGGADKGI